MEIWYHSLTKYCKLLYGMFIIWLGDYDDSYYECDSDDDNDDKINKIIVLWILVLQ